MRIARCFLAIAIAIALAAAPRLVFAQGEPDSTRCFEFDKSYFGYPPLSTPVVALTPLHHVEPRLGSEGRVIELPTLHPDSAERDRRQRFSGWAPLHEDSVIVVWRNGFAGYRMRLAERHDSLVGIGRFVTDDRRRTMVPEKVRARRIDCP